MKSYIKNRDGYFYEKEIEGIPTFMIYVSALLLFINLSITISLNINQIKIEECYKYDRDKCIIYRLSNDDLIYTIEAMPDSWEYNLREF